MPPRAVSSQGSGGPNRGRGSGRGRTDPPGTGSTPAPGRGTASRGVSPQSRGAPSRGLPSRGTGRPSATAGGRPGARTAVLPESGSHITTIGMKRTSFGTGGRHIRVLTNHFEATKIPEAIIHHYDVIGPSDRVLPARMNLEIVQRLQTVVAPEVFTPRVVYDGRKNVFAARELPFGPSRTHEFDVTLVDPPSPGEVARTGREGRPPKVYKVKLTHAATINPEVLLRFLQGKQSHNNDVLTAIMALNVVIRMDPTLQYPFNVRSFFTDRERQDVRGSGFELWRGYFQSARPAIGRMLINVDISTGTMYKAGPLLRVAMDFLGLNDPNRFAQSFSRDRIRLQRFLAGVRIVVDIPGLASAGRAGARPPRVVKRITDKGSNALFFVNRDKVTLSVEQYFQQTHNYRLRYPQFPCVEVGAGALIPIECCTIPAGQIMRKQVPPQHTKAVLDFATKKPVPRLDAIRTGLQVLQYGQSEYLRVNPDPVSLDARVLDAPTLRYGPGSGQPTIRPRDGAWNMIDKKFYKPASIARWCVVIFERQGSFRPDVAQRMVEGLLRAFQEGGMTVGEQDPIIEWANGSNDVANFLKSVGRQCYEKNDRSGGPSLIVAVLPEASVELYMRIKHFGDITQGVATQCLQSRKCSFAKAQYYANVSLKVNVKLGGINTVPEARSVPALTDPHNPTIVMGADVIHPAPGVEGRPSFASLVMNVDSDVAKYIADCRAQPSRQEMIHGLKEMAIPMMKMVQGYRAGIEKKSRNPTRVIFFRDGVSEGEFRQVLENELPQLKAACAETGINAKITVIVVGKRHHVRFIPQNPQDADRSENCPAGTVIDSDITHPLENDFYLQLWTSRPAHYNVLYDDNRFTADNLQALSFALCHVYARATRSVSIPAPVYYADIVCARARNHFDPDGGMDFEGSGVSLDEAQATTTLEAFQRAFKPLHTQMRRVMYFS
ncbi:argonaute-like protein [Trametes elegans]|nr:argonaute-like protein [Trametes elegans]